MWTSFQSLATCERVNFSGIIQCSKNKERKKEFFMFVSTEFVKKKIFVRRYSLLDIFFKKYLNNM